MGNMRQLGRFVFEIRCDDPEQRAQLNSLFRPYKGTAPPDVTTVDGTNGGVRTIVNVALKNHDNCLWIDAAALLSPNGKRILIAGASHAGKSTCTTALAFRENWKVFSEDIVLFDTVRDKLICFASPFSMKPGTIDRLKAHNCKTPSVVLDEWIPLNDLAVGHEDAADIDLAFFFEYISDPTAPEALALTELTSAQYIRNLLPISNLLRDSKSMDKLSDYLARARCFSLKGGTISERLQKIEDLSSGRVER